MNMFGKIKISRFFDYFSRFFNFGVCPPVRPDLSPTCRGMTSNPTRQKLRSMHPPQRPRTPEPNSAARNSNSGSRSPSEYRRFWLQNFSKMVAHSRKSTMAYAADLEKAPSARLEPDSRVVRGSSMYSTRNFQQNRD